MNGDSPGEDAADGLPYSAVASGLCVFCVGIAVVVCVGVLVHRLFGEGSLPANFGAAATLGSILAGVSAMKDRPNDWARRRKWIVAAIPVSCASTLGAVIAGQIPGLAASSPTGGIMAFMAETAGACLATAPVLYLTFRRLKLFRN